MDEIHYARMLEHPTVQDLDGPGARPNAVKPTSMSPVSSNLSEEDMQEMEVMIRSIKNEVTGLRVS